MMVGGCFQKISARKYLVLSGWVIFFQQEVPSTFCVGIFLMQEDIGTFCWVYSSCKKVPDSKTKICSLLWEV